MDLYEEIGATKEMSCKEIKKLGRKIKLENHPDKGGDEEKFKKLLNAIYILSDEDKRRYYDEYGVDIDADEDSINRNLKIVFEKVIFGYIDGMFRSVVDEAKKELQYIKDQIVSNKEKKHKELDKYFKFLAECGDIDINGGFDFLNMVNAWLLQKKGEIKECDKGLVLINRAIEKVELIKGDIKSEKVNSIHSIINGVYDMRYNTTGTRRL